jgi:hypothetical protein
MIQITVCHSPVYHKRLSEKVRGRSLPIAHGLINRLRYPLLSHTPRWRQFGQLCVMGRFGRV